MTDARSNFATEYRHLYKTARWRRRRLLQLSGNPFCVRCQNEGTLTPATVADHVKPHKGELNLFYHGELQSLCAKHHNSDKQSEESRGYSTRVGPDGFPVDDDHPAMQKCGDTERRNS
jgi:5-methylcytosine-specific restriction protein A